MSKVVVEDVQGSGAQPAARTASRGGALSVTRRQNAVLALLVGDLAAAEARQLRRRLVDAAGEGPTAIFVDASAAGWLSDGVLDVLQEEAGSVRATGGELVVVDPRPDLERRLQQCGIAARSTRFGGTPT